MCKPPRLGAPWPSVSSLLEATRARARNTCSPLSGRPCESRENSKSSVAHHEAPAQQQHERAPGHLAHKAAPRGTRDFKPIISIHESHELQQQRHEDGSTQQQLPQALRRPSNEEPRLLTVGGSNDAVPRTGRKSFPKSNRVALQRHAHINSFAASRLTQIEAAVRRYFAPVTETSEPEHTNEGLVRRKVAFYSDWWRAAFETSGEDVYEALLFDMRRTSAGALEAQKATALAAMIRSAPDMSAHAESVTGHVKSEFEWSTDNADIWAESLDEDGFDLGHLEGDMMVVVTAA